MSRNLSRPMIVLAMSLLVSACAQQQRTETTPPPAEPAAPAPIELTPAKVAEIAQIAAQMEKDSSTRTELLKQHGFTQEQLDQAIARIMADPTMSAAFEQGKTAAQTPAAGGAETGQTEAGK